MEAALSKIVFVFIFIVNNLESYCLNRPLTFLQLSHLFPAPSTELLCPIAGVAGLGVLISLIISPNLLRELSKAELSTLTTTFDSVLVGTTTDVSVFTSSFGISVFAGAAFTLTSVDSSFTGSTFGFFFHWRFYLVNRLFFSVSIICLLFVSSFLGSMLEVEEST